MAVHVTDHALLRYLERVGEYDVEEIRRQMVTKELTAAVKFSDTGKFPVGDGKHVYVVQGGRVVTIAPK